MWFFTDWFICRSCRKVLCTSLTSYYRLVCFFFENLWVSFLKFVVWLNILHKIMQYMVRCAVFRRLCLIYYALRNVLRKRPSWNIGRKSKKFDGSHWDRDLSKIEWVITATNCRLQVRPTVLTIISQDLWFLLGRVKYEAELLIEQRSRTNTNFSSRVLNLSLVKGKKFVRE